MRFLVIPLLLVSNAIVSQTLFIDFENKNLDNWQERNSNHWEIDTTSPISGNASLHHAFDDSVSNFDGIAFPHEQLLFDSAQTSWEFKVMYGYNPSGSNNWAFCLASLNGIEQINPNGNATSYFIGVNFTGSDDLIKFWKKDGTTNSVIFATSYNWQENISDNDTVSFRTTRSLNGTWNFYLKKGDEGSWIDLGSCEEKSIRKSYYLGIYYEYSSTKDQLLWIDDIQVEGFFYTDKEPPSISRIAAIEKNILEIEFSEEIDTVNAMMSFDLNNGDSPTLIKWYSASSVQLTFESSFDLNNTLVISNLSDLFGNIAGTVRSNFEFYLPQIYDVIFTEIMADPSDPVGLPEEEYLEIYNRSPYAIDIEDWKLYVGNKSYTLPDTTIQPGLYYILTSNAENWGELDSSVIEVHSFPSLTNSGTLIQLKDEYGTTIHAVQYTDEWYDTDYKQEGGWSLEMVSVDEPCLEEGNWKESTNSLGGTPGAINSYTTAAISYPEVEVQKITVSDSNVLLLQFSASMDSTSLVEEKNYTFPNTLHLDYIEAVPPFYNQAYLYFSTPFEEGSLYEIIPQNKIVSCFGDPVTEIPLEFGLPQAVEKGNLIINEILFESSDGVPEFVEFMNLSGNVLELKGLSIGLMDTETGELEKETLLTSENLQILPEELYVFTENKSLLLETFVDCKKNNVFELESWPTLNNDGGKIVLSNGEQDTVDMAIYNPDMHFPLLIEQGGVSLEKINPSLSGETPNSWQSAASDVGYATPTLKNSQFTDPTEINRQITLSPKELSPDNDGIDDFLQISYAFENPGFTLSATVYNQTGGLIKKIADNETCGTSGSFIWNGLSKDGNRLPMGYYIVLIQAMNTNGEVIKRKEAILILPEKK